MSIYSKTLSGQNTKLFVSPAVNYTAQTTFSAFATSAAVVDGEIGVFLDTGAVRTTALTAGLKFFVAQKRGGIINKTPIIEWDRLISKVRTAYDAPVNQVTSIGYIGSGALDLSIDFTAASATNTITLGLSCRETTPGNQPFPVQEGYATVNSPTADEYTAIATIVSQLNGDYDYERTQPDRFVKAEIQMDGTRTALAANATVTNGRTLVTVTAHALTVGTLVSLANVVYKIATVVDANNFTIDRPYQGPSATITAGTSTTTASSVTYVSGTNKIGVRFTTINVESVFKVVGIGNLYLSPVTPVTNWKLGSGSGATVAEWEKNDAIFFDGVGSTRNAAFAADYGQPTLFASVSQIYDLFFLNFGTSITPSAGPPAATSAGIERVAFATPPTGASSPGDELQTIFGL
jgi:hypothetical protein